MAQRILVFESDAAFANEVRQHLGRMGADVAIVSDGNQGLEMASRRPPDLILLSIELPNLNGYLVCKKLKKQDELKNIPLIILSNAPDADEMFEQHKRLRTRAEDYVRKPIDFASLLERMRQFVDLPDGAAPGDAGQSFVVDEEIDAFAENAFDSLVIAESPDQGAAVPAEEDAFEPVDIGTGESLTLEEVEAVESDGDEFGDDAERAPLPQRDSSPSLRPGRSATRDDSGARPAASIIGSDDVSFLEARVDELQRELDRMRERAEAAEGAPGGTTADENVAHRLEELELEVVSLREVANEVEDLRGAAAEVEALREALARAEQERDDADRGRAPDRGGADEVALRDATLEIEQLRSEMESLRSAAAENELLRGIAAEVDGLRSRAAEADRLEREVVELRAKGGKGGVSSRDFLDLREALNRKDKEILDLKDLISGRDKQLLDLRDTNLALERERADLEDRSLDVEQRLTDITELSERLGADKEAAAKRAEDLRGRLERTEARLRKSEEDLDEARRTATQDKAAYEAERERLAAEHARALEEERADRARENADTAARHAAAIDDIEARQAAELSRRDEAHRNEREREAAEHEEAFASERARHASALEERTHELEQAREAALDALRTELETRHAAELAAADERRVAELEHAARERADEVTALRDAHGEELDRRTKELEAERAKELSAVREQHGRELAVLGRKLTETEANLRSSDERLSESKAHASSLEAALRTTEERLGDAESRGRELEAALGERTEERDRLVAELRAAQLEREDLQAACRERDESIDALRARVEGLEHDLQQALTKISRDEELLERVRRAMGIGLALLDEQKQNVVQS